MEEAGRYTYARAKDICDKANGWRATEMPPPELMVPAPEYHKLCEEITADAMERRMPGRGGFTILELLVVIAVIALVVSLLAAALAPSYRSAKAARCAANLHSLATATVQYAHETGWMPPGGLEVQLAPPAAVVQALELPEAVWRCPLDREPGISYAYLVHGITGSMQDPHYRLSDLDARIVMPALFQDDAPRHDGKRLTVLLDGSVAPVGAAP